MHQENKGSQTPCKQAFPVRQQHAITPMETSPLPAPIFYSPTKLTSNNSFDRFIPTRLGNNWQTTFSMINEGSRSAGSKKSRENNGEANRDGIAYSCLLKNELLGKIFIKSWMLKKKKFTLISVVFFFNKFQFDIYFTLSFNRC